MINIIEMENLHYRYRDGTKALQGLSLFIPQGKKVAILGPNGAGKSTLLLHLNGLYLPQKGKVRVLGREINSRTERWVKSKVGLVFQDPDDQVFSATVKEDVAFGPLNMNLPEPEVQRRVSDALQAVQMEEYSRKPPYYLSHGQKKRVAIAGVLAMQPEVILLDEPTSYLDPKSKITLIKILNQLHRQGTTIAIATHDVDLAAEWADHIIIIKEGQTLAQGETWLLTREDLIEEAGLCFPTVVQIFRQLPDIKKNYLPLNVNEAVTILKSIITAKGEARHHPAIGR